MIPAPCRILAALEPTSDNHPPAAGAQHGINSAESDASERYFLAALLEVMGRAAARRAIAQAGQPRAAYLDLAGSSDRPARLASLCRRHGVAVLVPQDPDYPALLRAVPDPPPLLYARGDLTAVLRPCVAVVGARRCSRLGAEVASAVARSLAARGICVVSGLALGIDSAAHRAATRHGVSIAVIGSGVLSPYPAANRRLLDSLLRGGGLCLSEYPPRAGARPYHFPERNRVISGLCLGVVVVEAGARSGSLITARMALEQGREVCAVPGPVTSPSSRGCHDLLRQGAVLVENGDDVIEALGLRSYVAARSAEDQDAEGPDPDVDRALARVLAAVEGQTTSLDSIVAATGRDAAGAAAALVELELAGFVRQVPGGYIRRPS